MEWVDPAKPVLPQVYTADDQIELELSVKCHPYSTENILQDITVKLFYHHAKDVVLSGALAIEESMLLKLASLQAIASYGPFISDVQDIFVKKLLRQEKFFPDEYDMTDESPAEVKTKIAATYEQLGSLLKEDAMEEYLKTAARINGYGVEYYQVTTRERKNETLEVASSGMLLYPSTKVGSFRLAR